MRRVFPELLVVCLLATGGALLLLDEPRSPSGPPPAAEQAGVVTKQVAPAPDPDDPTTWQTSDQVPGEIATTQPGLQRAAQGRTRFLSYKPAPGVTVRGWDARTRRGPVRYYVMRVKWKKPGITVDYAYNDRVRRRKPVTEMLAGTKGVVAGINGDFFDISDTGAPLGLGFERGGLLLNGIDEGWNNALSIRTSRKVAVGRLPLVGSVEGHPEIKITNYNSPRVKVNGTGIYDWRFGRAAGLGWTDGQKRQVRCVQIVDGVVVSNSTTIPGRTGIKGTWLIARGDKPEDRLRALKVGTKVNVERRLAGKVAMAITGNALLVKNRKLVATDDRVLHPRTAIGVDRDTKELIFLVVDGRQSFSRGYTMVELGKMMLRLGAEAALNLDGGGSTTLAAVRKGKLTVLNSPSDGVQRPVPNGVEVIYRPPAG